MNDRCRSVLVIDDEVDMAEMIQFVLAGKGYDVRMAHSGPAAVALAETHPFDGVLCDLMMPDWDGIRTIRALKQVKPQLPIVLVTGYLSQDAKTACEEQGVSHFLKKPFTTKELEATLTGVIGGAAEPRGLTETGT